MDVNDLKKAVLAAPVGNRRLNDIKDGATIEFKEIVTETAAGQTTPTSFAVFVIEGTSIKYRVTVNALAGMRIANVSDDKLKEVKWSIDARTSEHIQTMMELLQSEAADEADSILKIGMKLKVIKKLMIPNNMATPEEGKDYVPTLQNPCYEGYPAYLQATSEIRQKITDENARNDAFNVASNALRSSKVKKAEYLTDTKRMMYVPVFTLAS